MGKKKGRRQSDPSRDECESTDEETVGLELEVQSSCPHTGVIVLMFRATYILSIVVIIGLGLSKYTQFSPNDSLLLYFSRTPWDIFF